MTSLTILNLKTSATHIECFNSKDKLEARLQELHTDPQDKKLKKGEYLDGWSYDTKSEKELIESYLPVDRQVRGRD